MATLKLFSNMIIIIRFMALPKEVQQVMLKMLVNLPLHHILPSQALRVIASWNHWLP